jgi:hypothetical protein
MTKSRAARVTAVKEVLMLMRMVDGTVVRRVALAVVTLAACTAIACGGGSKNSTSVPTSPTSTSTPPPTRDANLLLSATWDRYQAGWNSYQTLRFPPTAINTIQQRDVVFYNLGKDPLTITKFNLNNPALLGTSMWSFSWTAKTIPSGQSATLTITFAPKSSPSSTLTLSERAAYIAAMTWDSDQTSGDRGVFLNGCLIYYSTVGC